MELCGLPTAKQSKPIARSLHDSADYQPDWRHLVLTEYIVRITKSTDQSAELEAIFLLEKDPYLRQLLNFHFNRRCIISESIRYALTCKATNARHRLATAIKAMTLAGRSVGQIAAELATAPQHIACFQKIFFDVGRYLDHRLWLKTIAFKTQTEAISSEEERERRWLQEAYMRGWSGVAQLLCNRVPDSRRNTKMEVDQLMYLLVARATDYVMELEALGIPATESDLERLALFAQRIQHIGGDFRAEDFSYNAPLDPAEQKKANEAKEVIGRLSPLGRKKLKQLLDKIKAESSREEELGQDDRTEN
jgi:hypothetical protein